jgi:hypothetical protein
VHFDFEIANCSIVLLLLLLLLLVSTSEDAMSFDLSSSSSDDESSVVEISALLTGVNNEDGIINSTTNNSLSHHGDEPSSPNNDDDDDDDDDNNRIQREKHDAAKTSSSTIIKETEKEFVNKKNCNDNKTRFVMGESVKVWRRHRNKANNNSTILTQPTGSDTRINNTNNPPKYVMIQQKDNCTSGRIDFKNAHVNVKKDDEEDKVEIIVASTSSSSSTTSSSTTSYLPVKAKRQLPHHENQTTASSSSSSSSSLLPVFVDCVAIWDSQRQVYILEVPELIIKDVTMPPSAIAVGINKSLRNQNNDVHVNINNDFGNNSALRQYDPLKQQRKAESKLLNHRKRRRS